MAAKAKAKRSGKRSTPSKKETPRSQSAPVTLLTRRNAILAWIAGFALLIAIALAPPSFDITRRSTVFLVILLSGGWLGLIWRYALLRWTFIALYTALVAFFLLPGRLSYDRPLLRAETAEALRRYHGVRYYWGGENRFGIDCSGIIRRGAVDSLLLEGFRSLNPHLVRKGLDLWWRDLSASDMEKGAKGQARRLFKAPSLRDADPAILYPGDFAITQGGAHALAYLGNSIWIEADPGAGKVITLDARTSANPWMTMPVTILRWNHLFIPRSQPR